MSDPQSDPQSHPQAGSIPARPARRFPDALRAPIVAVLAAALIIGGLISRAHASTPAPAGNAASVLPAVPVAAPAAALSSSWFCAGATDAPSSGTGGSRGAAPGAVIIANEGGAPAQGVVTLVPSAGADVRVPVTVQADSRLTVAENVPHGTAWIGAIVDIDAGSVAVEQQVNGSLGRATSPCATAGSSQWYFATGATLINASVGLSLLNPYPAVAVVDLSFTTDQGFEQPQPFQGLIIPPDGLLHVNLGDHMRRRQAIATTVTARSGRLVAWKTDVVTPPASGEALLGTPAANAPFADPAAPVAGVTLTLGAAGGGTEWTWPSGLAGNGVSEQYVIYNPGTETAQLRLSMALDLGVAEPFDLSVGPEQVTTVLSNQEVRIPPGENHTAVLQSLNDVPVVAERAIAAATPSAWSGLGELPGGQIAATRWLLASGTANKALDGWIVLYDPGSVPTRVVLTGLNQGHSLPLAALTVPAGRRAAVHLNQVRSVVDEPIVVAASSPVYVESDAYGQNGAAGVDLSFGVPLSP